MEMKHQLRQTLTQKLIMTQKLRQALKLLTLPTLELREELKTELQTNPLLEEVDEISEEPDVTLDGNGEAEPATDTPEEDGPDDEVDWEAYLQDASDVGTVPTPERQEEQYERVNVSVDTLEDFLREQLLMRQMGPEDEAVTDFLLGSLDDRGYLTMTDAEIVELTGTEPERVERLVGYLRQCEPAGVGARDLRESLLIQLKARDLGDGLSYQIVQDHWEALKNRRLTDIARAFKVPVQTVQEAMDVIAGLNPNPGAQLAGTDARYVYPDLVVERVGEDYVVFLNDRNVPRLRINRAYEKVILGQGGDDQKTKDFVRAKLKSARWIVQTIEQRRRTMVKVMQKIVEKQRAFFDHGVLHLRPLTLQDVAREIEMHESTVSRVTSGKYVQTPRGVFELKFFFSSGLGTSDGEDISSKAAKEKITRLIEVEEKRRPLSDQKIADTLRAEGVDIARRTVAKYREALGIASARLRRRH
jgi:RNA polymerase sigma-54 factor